MTEEQIKLFCKWAIQNSRHPLTDMEKEVLKQAVDSAKNIEDLLAVAIAASITDFR